MFKGSPLSDKFQTNMQQLGIAILATLMTLALYNDIARIFGN
jgi:membrane-associated protease RseP (regulator of RpoE activity)